QWPRAGTPPVPRAWIIPAAKYRAIDRMRRGDRLERKLSLLKPAIEGISASLESPAVIADDQLRLLYTCCHPSLALDAQVALTLRTLCGLTTEQIARACLVPTPTMAQRLVRAQRKIRDAA
ncbi:MAG: sigma factor-like helix-turn-helix DNA-binding protein, partial [bacterium]